MNDVVLQETGNGGDVVLSGNIVQMSSSLWNMVYMALFGGNPDASTTGNEEEFEQRKDCWMNDLFWRNNPEIQFNSITEATLNTTTLNSEGRVTIENAVKTDLKFLNKFGNISVSASIVSDDNVQIYIKINELSNQEDQEFQFIWDASKKEIIIENTI